jgi:hypothetical protein
MLKAIPKSRAIRLALHLTIATLTTLGLLLWKAEVRDSGVFQLSSSQPATAQSFRPQDAWRQAYERLPNLPRENQYVSQETGEVASEDTLVSRLIRYHLYVKSRPPNYRLDWKLTMADYLGAHEYLEESTYPSASTLQQNPMEGDRTVIQNMSRAERDDLINVLVSIFNPTINQTSAPAPAPAAPTASPPPTTPNRSTAPRLPQPGDAQLLLP